MNSGINNEISVEVKDLDCEFLPIIYDIIKCVEKDPSEASLKNKESLEAANKIQELNKKLEKAREQVRSLKGIDLNPEEQKAQLQSLKKQRALKKELVQKYESLGSVANFLNLGKLNGTSE
ncbi:mediator of RNA polymerase II transcription subunit 9-like [Eurytemora carolleeae]|uniref:mediator of RNA polymerase II transcription subunit 9-like n=1 Tax=Eurytemora carolleeae TaxID=1294199 RepID=UPI000C78D86B|nr:mediator of RNA polymerase II transcription subunit 9-like [Eurytemora carolleeae]|eukprot:XP_023332277.1 mediator of RNA polymerase II transcription subunit 9-like [Eurytemora affinis]